MQGGGAGGAPSCGRRGRAAPWDAAAERGNAAPSSPGTRRQRGVVAPPSVPAPPARAGASDPAGNEPRNCERGRGEDWKRGAGTGTSGPLSLSSARELRGGGAAGREGTPSPSPVYLGPRRFLRLFVCSAAPPCLPACRRARGGRGDTRRDAAGPPPRRASPGSDGSERRCAPHRQPRAHSGDTRGAPGLRALRARTGCAHGTHAGAGRGRCGVRVGSAATHGPNVPRRSAGPADPRRCGHGPLKLARLPAPRFYGPICLRRALPSPVNHSARGGSGR